MKPAGSRAIRGLAGFSFGTRIPQSTKRHRWGNDSDGVNHVSGHHHNCPAAYVRSINDHDRAALNALFAQANKGFIGFDHYLLIEKVRSIVVRLPCWFRTETVSLPWDRSRIGRESVSSQREPGRAWNFFAKFLPA